MEVHNGLHMQQKLKIKHGLIGVMINGERLKMQCNLVTF